MNNDDDDDGILFCINLDKMISALEKNSNRTMKSIHTMCAMISFSARNKKRLYTPQSINGAIDL